jgi:hypothetical protein
LKDKLAFNGRPFISMVNGGTSGTDYSNSFRIQLAASMGDKTAGPAVLV